MAFCRNTTRSTSMQRLCRNVASVFWLACLCTRCVYVEGDKFRQYNVGEPAPKHANVNITYMDPVTGEYHESVGEGHYGLDSRTETKWGWVVHVRTTNNHTHGCSPPVNLIRKERQIALIKRGTCKFSEKIFNAAVKNNASAVVIYNDKHEKGLLTMEHNVDDVVSVFISKAHGERIATLVDNGTPVMMNITEGKGGINKASVLFVSFIDHMSISLAWFVFYYIQF